MFGRGGVSYESIIHLLKSILAPSLSIPNILEDKNNDRVGMRETDAVCGSWVLNDRDFRQLSFEYELAHIGTSFLESCRQIANGIQE